MLDPVMFHFSPLMQVHELHAATSSATETPVDLFSCLSLSVFLSFVLSFFYFFPIVLNQ